MSASSRHTHESMEPSIEVATLLGDSVIDIKHCLDPRTGKLARATWALIAGGALALLASAIAFAHSVGTAAANQRALAAWVAAHRPAGAFRPVMLGVGWDAVAFGGLAVGLGALALALVRARDERRSPYFRIGTAPDVDQPVAGLAAASFPLVAPSGDDFVLHFAPGIEGELAIGGQTTSFAQLAASGRARPADAMPGAFAIAIPPQARIRARTGQTTFLVASVGRPRRHALPPLALFEGRAMRYFAGSLAAHVALLLLLQAMPEDAGAATVDLNAVEEVHTSGQSVDHDELVSQPDDGDGGGGAGLAAQAMQLEEGSAGSPTGASEAARRQIAHRDNGPERLSRAQAVDAARTAGYLGDAQLAGAIASIASESDTANGFDTRDVLGPEIGADGSIAGDGFGVGRRGFGPGGGGDSTIGISTYGVICDDATGNCTGGSGGYASGPGGLGGHKHVAKVPVVVVQDPTCCEGIDKAIIRRYIKRNLAKISYCYESELLARPELEGTISVQFFIQPDGSVTGATGSGFDGKVASCVAGVVAAIEFPAPGTGGGVQVNYPFTFHPAGH